LKQFKKVINGECDDDDTSEAVGHCMEDGHFLYEEYINEGAGGVDNHNGENELFYFSAMYDPVEDETVIGAGEDGKGV
jgi:hypothetical protein